LKALFEALSQEERDMIMGTKGAGKLPPKDTGKNNPINDPSTKGLVGDDVYSPSDCSKKQNSEDQENCAVCDLTPILLFVTSLRFIAV
jgi:hypothetical protein